MKWLSFVALSLSFSLAHAVPAKLAATCNVSEILADGQSKTENWVYYGSQQENQLVPLLMKDIKVTVRGTPGAVTDLQAFALFATIADAQTGVRSTSQAWFVNGTKYSEKFEKVIPGSLIVHISRPNGDKIEVSCFNPQK